MTDEVRYYRLSTAEVNKVATSEQNKEQTSAQSWNHGIHKWYRMAGA